MASVHLIVFKKSLIFLKVYRRSVFTRVYRSVLSSGNLCLCLLNTECCCLWMGLPNNHQRNNTSWITLFFKTRQHSWTISNVVAQWKYRYISRGKDRRPSVISYFLSPNSLSHSQINTQILRLLLSIYKTLLFMLQWQLTSE